jgi:heme/copper-type cytochrome/quinol oxidase subunit 2
MKGRVTYEPRPAFDAWLERKYAEQEAAEPRPEPTADVVKAD